MKSLNFGEHGIEAEIERIKQSGIKRRLLLHTCCAPCACGVLKYLLEYFDVAMYFYNPNIMPESEFNLRLNAVKQLIVHFPDIELIVPEQQTELFAEMVKGLETLPEGGERCFSCFELRLENCAVYLAEHPNMYDFFATTLTVSPHKNAKAINDIGAKSAERKGVVYLSSDFKKRNGYLHSIELSKKLGIYRQRYCGCKFDI